MEWSRTAGEAGEPEIIFDIVEAGGKEFRAVVNIGIVFDKS